MMSRWSYHITYSLMLSVPKMNSGLVVKECGTITHYSTKVLDYPQDIAAIAHTLEYIMPSKRVQ